MDDNLLDKAARQKQLFAGIFDRSAPTYDHVGPSFFTHYGQGLVDFAQIKPDAHVLDIATGRGAALFPAAEAVGRHGYVVGIDLAEMMVKETLQEVRHRKLKNVIVEQMDAENLRFPEESFHYVLCGFALFFFPQLDQALAEIRRVLKPLGCLAVSTWEKFEDERWSWYDKLVESFLPPVAEEPKDKSTQAPAPQLDTAASMKAVLEQAGFIEVQSRSEQLEVVYQSDEEWWSVQWSHGGRSVLEKIEATSGVDGLKRFKKAAFERLSYIKEGDGIRSAWPAIYTSARKPGLS